MGFHFGNCGKGGVKTPIKFCLGFFIYPPSKQTNKQTSNFLASPGTFSSILHASSFFWWLTVPLASFQAPPCLRVFANDATIMTIVPSFTTEGFHRCQRGDIFKASEVMLDKVKPRWAHLLSRDVHAPTKRIKTSWGTQPQKDAASPLLGTDSLFQSPTVAQ